VWAFAELLVEQMPSEGIYELYRQQAAALKPKPPPAPKMVYAIGSMEYAAEQERLRQRLQRAERGGDEDE
jgi:hypothetical protein